MRNVSLSLLWPRRVEIRMSLLWFIYLCRIWRSHLSPKKGRPSRSTACYGGDWKLASSLGITSKLEAHRGLKHNPILSKKKAPPFCLLHPAASSDPHSKIEDKWSSYRHDNNAPIFIPMFRMKLCSVKPPNVGDFNFSGQSKNIWWTMTVPKY